MTEKDSLRTERKKAHAKMRDEIRVGIKEATLKAGIGRDEIRQAVKDEIALAVKAAMNGSDLRRLITEILKAELRQTFGEKTITDVMKNALVKETQALAAKFVNDTILVKAIDLKETW